MSTKHTLQDFETHITPTWCPGCGDFGIWTAIKQAMVELNIDPDKLVVVFGIGCAGNQSNFVRAYGFHGLHGRALPVAEGIALANHGITTIVVGGDGDGYGEGIAHFIHTIRANPNITYIVHDNRVYGLTKGQTSPTTAKGTKTPSTPFGSTDNPVNPLALAISAGCGFVARGYAGDVDHLTKLIVDAVHHKGFSLVNVLQPCVTFNHINTYAWYYDRVVKLETLKHDPSDKLAAWERTQHDGEQMPIGLFFQEEKPALQEGYPVLAKKTLVGQTVDKRDIKKLLSGMK